MNKCVNCGKDTTNPSFCSRSCSATHNNRINPKRKRKRVICQCLTCSKEFLGHRHSAKFCCRHCDNEHKRKEADKKVLLNKGFASNAVNNTIRSFLIRQNGNHCMLCGMNASNWHGKPLTLIVDHIDGKSKNNSLDNVRLVCPNCDAQLPTFKGANKGNSDRSYFITQK